MVNIEYGGHGVLFAVLTLFVPCILQQAGKSRKIAVGDAVLGIPIRLSNHTSTTQTPGRSLGMESLTMSDNFEIAVANALEDILRLFKDHHQAIQDLQRLVSALDTRMDRVEVPQ